MKNTSLVINARVRSTRIENKMLRPFGDTCLLNIALDKLSRIQGFPKYLAAADPEIISIYQDKYSTSIDFLKRDMSAVLPKKDISRQDLTFAHYKNIDTPFIMTINACCPFFSEARIVEALDFFLNHEIQTMTTVKKNANIFFDNNHPINANGFVVASHGNRPLHEMAHVFHIFDKEFFLNKGYFWDYSVGNPFLFEVSKEESLDIDEQFDFDLCESIYKN